MENVGRFGMVGRFESSKSMKEVGHKHENPPWKRFCRFFFDVWIFLRRMWTWDILGFGHDLWEQHKVHALHSLNKPSHASNHARFMLHKRFSYRNENNCHIYSQFGTAILMKRWPPKQVNKTTTTRLTPMKLPSFFGAGPHRLRAGAETCWQIATHERWLSLDDSRGSLFWIQSAKKWIGVETRI